MKTIAILVNPAAGGGQGQRVWSQLEPRVRALCERLDVRLTLPGEDISALTRTLLANDPDCLIVIGGDGSLSHVVNALLSDDQPLMPALKVAYYNAGIGGDFVRQFPEQDINDFLENIVHHRTVTCDVGKIVFQSSGKPVRYFINIASCGLSAHVVKQAAKSRASKNRMGRIFYLWHGIAGIMSYQGASVLTVADGGESERHAVLLTAICNGQFFGGNMCIAPDARINDGLLDIVSFGQMNKMLCVRQLFNVYRGVHMTDNNVDYRKVRSLTINPLDQDVWVEADGDIAGQLPAHFSLLPAAFRLIV